MTDNPSDLCSACATAAMQNETFVTCDDGCSHGGCPWNMARAEKAEAERDAALNREVALREALTRAERKLAAYVGVCKDDKELTDTVLPMTRQALASPAPDGWCPN